MTDDARSFQFSDDIPADSNGSALIVRIPARLNRKRKLLAEYARQLRLPGYFGWNWDAFEECLRDLTWLEGITQVTIFHRDVPFANSPDLQEIYLSILRDRVREHFPGSKPVAVVFPVAAQRQLSGGTAAG